MGSACGQDTGGASSFGSSSSNISLCKSSEALEAIPSPEIFLIIIAIYVIQVTLILIFFTSKIEEGDNDLALKINIAKSLPIALIFFFISAWFASSLSGF